MLNQIEIKARREKATLTMQEAAERAGLGGKQRWYDIEKGKRPNPSIETMQRVAHVLGCKVDDLLLPIKIKPNSTRAK
jgi:transcriptional regulator with XRE-family HTH domain